MILWITMLARLLTACLLAGFPSVVLAQQGAPAAAAPTGSLRVPGGTAALLRVVGLDPKLPRARALPDVIRVVHEVGEGIDAEADARRARLFGYLEALSAFESARRPLASGVTLAAVEDRRTRKLIEDFAEAIGFSLERDGKQTRLVPQGSDRAEQRRTALAAAGFDSAEATSQLNSGASISPELPADEVPLPLPSRMWIPKNPVGPAQRFQGAMVAAILGDRKASLLYYGLCSMDDETLAYLASNPSVAAEAYNSNHVGTIALYGRSLRVKDGRVDLPGGTPAQKLWEQVADAPASDPERFILNVLSRDGGRLALLYDAIAQLDPDAQRFALGLWMPDQGERLDRFRDLYTASAASLAGWNPRARPFSRPLYDPAHVLLATAAGPGGNPAAPSSRRLWERVFDRDAIPDKPEDELGDASRDGSVDAASLVATICVVNSNLRRERAEAWLFAHRVFAGAPASALPNVLVALRGYQRFRALADTLERLGVTNPDAYAAVTRRAQRLADIGDRERAATAQGLFQGGLALIERARLARVLDVPATERLVASLSSVPVSNGDEFLGAMATWVEVDYLAAIRPAPTASTTEDRVLRAFSGGAAAGGTKPPVVEVERVRYEVDPAAPVLSRLRAVRERQGSWSLDDVLAFARAVDALARGVSSLDQLAERTAALRASTEPLLAVHVEPDAFVGPLDISRVLDDGLEGLARIDKPAELRKVATTVLPLRRSADQCLALALASLAYAPSLGEADGSVLVAGDPSPRHDFGLVESNGSVRTRNPWHLPAESHEGTGKWHVAGALLGLDVGLGKLGLRRISTDPLPDAPVIKANERQAFTEAVVLANAFDYEDEALRALVEAIRRGRARVAALASVPAGLTEIVEQAAIDPARRRMLAWTLQHEPDRGPEFFSVAEFASLGRRPGDPPLDLEPWGTSGWSLEGALRLRVPPSRYWATLAGRQGKGLMSALVPDLTLLVAEILADHGLPAALAPSILAAATQDVVDGLRPSFDDDWLSMVSQIQQLVPMRADDYVNSVITGGVLVPAAEGADGTRDR